MNRDELHKKLIEVASQSPAKKRKVGAILAVEELPNNFTILSTGCNYNIFNKPCEDANGNTVDDVIHAEVSCLSNFAENNNIKTTKEAIEYLGMAFPKKPKLYVSHPPCDGCKASIASYELEYEVMGDFLKFDSDKPRVFHVPGSLTMWVGKVITYGIKKYKINNWRKVKSQESYWNALDRHLCAVKAGELIDPETGLPHAAHIACNAAFLLELQHLPMYITDDGEEVNTEDYAKLFEGEK